MRFLMRTISHHFGPAGITMNNSVTGFGTASGAGFGSGLCACPFLQFSRGGFGVGGRRVVFSTDATQNAAELENDHLMHVTQHLLDHDQEALYEEMELADFNKIKKTIGFKQLGIAKQVWLSIRGGDKKVDPALRMLSERIFTRMKNDRKNLIKDELVEKNFGVGAVIGLKNHLSEATSELFGHGTSASDRAKEVLGSSTDVVAMLKHVVGKMKSKLDDITPADGLAIVMKTVSKKEFTGTPTLEDVLEAMGKATPGKLEKLAKLDPALVDSRGNKIFVDNPAFKNLILFRKLAVEETMKMLTNKHYDAHLPMTFWHDLEEGHMQAKTGEDQKMLKKLLMK